MRWNFVARFVALAAGWSTAALAPEFGALAADFNAACPSAATDPPACPAGSALGTSVDSPLEWGPQAAGSQLWSGRLACADGRIAVMKRLGAAGTPSKASSSPASGIANLGHGDVVDAWQVGCPSGHWTLYTNVYRCGTACLPPTLKVMPAAAVKHADAASTAAHGGNASGAVAEARALTDGAPDHERAWVVRGGIAEQLGRWDEALLAWEGARARFPGPVTESHRAEALARTGKLDEARKIAAESLTDAPDGPMRPRLLCVQALTEVDPAKAKILAGEACGEGYAGCCSR